MTAILVIAKAFMLVAIATAMFFGLAMGLGVDTLADENVASCGPATPYICLFTIV